MRNFDDKTADKLLKIMAESINTRNMYITLGNKVPRSRSQESYYRKWSRGFAEFCGMTPDEIKANREKFEAYYKANCFHKDKCTIELSEASGLATFGRECEIELVRRDKFAKEKEADPDIKMTMPEPNIVISAPCLSDVVKIGVGDYTKTFKKTDFGYIVIFSDFLVVLIFIYFIYILDKG